MNEGTKGTCRYCRQELALVTEITYYCPNGGGPPFWRHTDLDRGECKTQWDDLGVHCANTQDRIRAPWGLPIEWCWYPKEDGSKCEKPVRDENIAGHFYACGTHMKKFVEDKEFAENRKRTEEDKASREEMEKWELNIYNEAISRLNSLNPMLFPDDRIVTYRWQSWSRKIEVDIADLERWVREIVAYAPSGGWESSGQDDDSLSRLFEQPQEAG